MQSTTGLRDKKKQAARDALERAGLRLFREKGFVATSIDEIAAAADFSRSTFFRHFGSKEALIFAEVDAQGERLKELLMKRPSKEPQLRAFEEAVVELSRESMDVVDPYVARARRSLINSDPYLKPRSRDLVTRWEERIALVLAQRDGLGEPEARHKMTATVGIAVIALVGDEWEASSPDTDPEPMIRRHFELLRELVR